MAIKQFAILEKNKNNLNKTTWIVDFSELVTVFKFVNSENIVDNNKKTFCYKF